MTEATETNPAVEAISSAYDLLTRPTLSLTDDEVTAIVADLQKRRVAYVDSKGKAKDEPAKERAKAKRTPASAADKAANTAAIAAAMNLDFDL